MPGTPDPEGAPFIGLLVNFADELRAVGLAVGSGDVLVYCSALSCLDPADLVDLYWAGRTTLVKRHDDIAKYDEVFRRFFLDAEGPEEDVLALMLRELRDKRGLDLDRVSKVDVIHGRMIVEYRDGSVAVDEPVKDFHGAALKGCDECADFLGRSALANLQ